MFICHSINNLTKQTTGIRNIELKSFENNISSGDLKIQTNNQTNRLFRKGWTLTHGLDLRVDLGPLNARRS